MWSSLLDALLSSFESLLNYKINSSPKLSVIAMFWRTMVVEPGGVEPPSESVLTQNSPGADGYFGQLPKELGPVFLPVAQAVTRLRFGSFIVHGTGKAYRTHVLH